MIKQAGSILCRALSEVAPASIRCIRFALSAAGIFVIVCSAGGARAERLPADCGYTNVREFGAKGDGVSDDTTAIRNAIAAAQPDQGKFFWPARIVYFPAGTYRVTDTLWKRTPDGRFLSSMSLVGESRDKVRIKLDDQAEGFGNPASPKAVIYTTSSLPAGSPSAGGKDYSGKGEGNDAYGNYIEDMTVDVGKGNPGAIGIDFLASNIGAIRHVTVVAASQSGRTGISMERKWPGPQLLSDVRVEGFARGIAVRYFEYSVTMEDIHLIGQTDVALRNDGNSLAIRHLEIETPSAAIQNASPASMIVADGISVRLTGPGGIWAENRGYMTFKGVKVTRARKGSNDRIEMGVLESEKDGAYFLADKSATFGADWHLTVPPTPKVPASPVTAWANVERYGARPNSGQDATTAIRAALNSGADIVYFPSGRYVISDAIEVPARVQRIAGMYSVITVVNRAPAFGRDMGMFRVSTGGAPLTIDRLALDNSGQGAQLGIEQSGARPLVLRDFITYAMAGVQRNSIGGPLFMENTTGGRVTIDGQEGAWFSQFNTEGPNVRIVNKGSPLVILGLKSEQNSTLIDNGAGAETEVLGGLVYLVHPPKDPRPAFVNHEGGKLFAAYVESAYENGAFYSEHLVQVGKDGDRQAVTADQLPTRGRARILPGMSLPRPPQGADTPSGEYGKKARND